MINSHSYQRNTNLTRKEMLYSEKLFCNFNNVFEIVGISQKRLQPINYAYFWFLLQNVFQKLKKIKNIILINHWI